MAPLIEIKGLTKKYRIGREVITALDNVSVDIEPGEFVCLLGPSGSGKTTFLHLVAGLDRPTRGDVFVKGLCINKIREKDMALFRRRFMAFIFQSYNLVPTLSALENVSMPLMFDGMAKNRRNRRAKDLLTQIGLGKRLRNKPSEMSGGQQQRVSIARALINDPKVLYADEPTGNLDSRTTKEIMDILVERVKEKGVTLVMVTHNANLTEHADRVIYMLDGRIQKIVDQRNNTEEVFFSEEDEIEESEMRKEDAKNAYGEGAPGEAKAIVTAEAAEAAEAVEATISAEAGSGSTTGADSECTDTDRHPGEGAGGEAAPEDGQTAAGA
ncbi:MAG: ABC transporter ATP-binding protein [Clostridiales bacterium]|nr:ABC transporter ATP-binding protein [Clostridiales bacterium]